MSARGLAMTACSVIQQTPACVAVFFLGILVITVAGNTATDSGVDDVLKVDTFDWFGGQSVVLSSSWLPSEENRQAASANGFLPENARPKKRRLAASYVLLLCEECEDNGFKADKCGCGYCGSWGNCSSSCGKDPYHRAAIGPRCGKHSRSDLALLALWDRPSWRDYRLNLYPAEGEHPCFTGFQYMIHNTSRCNGWTRQYPDIGGKVVFFNTGVNRYSDFTLKAFIAGYINVWLENGSSQLHEDVSVKAAKIYTNQYNIEELRPSSGSESWMYHECKVMGSMPFMYTCSNRINILVQKCNVENAWVMQSDYLRNFPGPATKDSPSNHDIVFYMCHELLDRNPNPYAAANTFAHELAHVIQGGFGYSFNTMTEGGATWLEGPLLDLAPRPMVYAWGFRDWNNINSAHFHANTRTLNSRKFYQIHGMFLTYLSQPELLGDHATSALQNYQTFDPAHHPFGRGSYDYFLQNVRRPVPIKFETVQLDVKTTQNSFASTLLDFRVAIASQCIVDAAIRPTAAKYLMPPHLRDRPFWDCTSYRTFWSADSTSAENISSEIHYGGAAVFRLAMVGSAIVSLNKDADPKIRTKVLAAGVPSTGSPAEVVELAPGMAVNFSSGAREIFVVQVNVDPEGEFIGPSDRAPLWKWTFYGCNKICKGKAWWAGSGVEGVPYPPDTFSGLKSRPIKLPVGQVSMLKFHAKWDLEPFYDDGNTVGEARCKAKGFDGVQVRVHEYSGNTDNVASVEVLSPDGGYGKKHQGHSALHAFAESGLYPVSANCSKYTGWADSNPWAKQSVSLTAYAGKRVSVEFLFASDSTDAREGFWVGGIRVQAANKNVYVDGVGADHMIVKDYIPTVKAGSLGQYDGVPVVAALPDGYEFDTELQKAALTRSAAWSASWANPRGSEASIRREYLGWSYSAPIANTKTALLHPGQEACVTLRAPFRGHVQTATLFTLVDKIGVSSISLALRSVEAPHGLTKGLKPIISQSSGVTDPGTHRFDFSSKSPTFGAEETFMVCVGVVGVKALPADDPSILPFVHLPLTNVTSAGEAGKAGATMLIVPPARGLVTALDSTGLDPWDGHTFVVRAEFVGSLGGDDADRIKSGFLAYP